MTAKPQNTTQKPSPAMSASAITRNRFPPLSLIFLGAVILTLPLFEAPKTVFLLLFFAVSLHCLWRQRKNVTWNADDVLLGLWMASGFAVAYFAGIHYKEWGGANGPLQLGLLLLLLKHTRIEQGQLKWLLYAILFSTLIANIQGLWQLWVGQARALELKSVGHVNHSAIYLCLNFGVALAMTLTLNQQNASLGKTFIIVSLVLTAVSVLLSNSRATIMTMGLMALSFGLIWLKRSKWPLLLLLLTVGLSATTLYFSHARVVQKHLIHTSKSFLGERQPIWNSALLIWRHNPLFGIGIKNYGHAGPEIQKQWLAQEGLHYDGEHYLAYAHAHSFYLTNLAEQGLFGLGITLAVLLRIAWLLYRHPPREGNSDDYWIVWLAAFGTLQVILINGIFNTTLHHEHGLLSTLLLGLWWSQADNSQALQTMSDAALRRAKFTAPVNSSLNRR